MPRFALATKICSTQSVLVSAARNGLGEYALGALAQTHGIGSNANTWHSEASALFPDWNSAKFNEHFEGIDLIFDDELENFSLEIENNLYLSFVLNSVPKDLALQSASIYYSMLMRMVLSEQGSKVYIKWPNDFYLENKKIGGLMSTKIKDKLVCGIGLNITNAPENAGLLDIKISYANLLKAFFDKISQELSWKEIFQHFKSDFSLSQDLYFKHEDNQYLLKEARLYEDGSILLDNKRIYSLR